MRLTKLFMLTTAVLLTLVTIMLIRSIWNDWNTVRHARIGLDSMELAYLAMKVAEKASAERGPTIPVLNDTAPADPAKRERLTKAREASDRAFADAISGLSTPEHVGHREALQTLRRAQAQLADARREVERVAALSYEERTAPGSLVRRVPIDQMFAVIDTLLDGVTSLTASTLRTYPELSQPLEGARLGAILREYAGRLGSQFTTPLALQKPLSERERDDIHALIGRIEQLRQLIEMQAQTNLGEPRVVSALGDMKARYFAVGLPFIESLTAAGIAGRPYGMETSQFVARYVPEMTSIVTMRDAMFAVARDGANARVTAALASLRTNALIGALVLAVEIGVFLLIRRRVLRPLLESTRALVRISEGKRDSSLRESARKDEIGDLQRALVALSKNNERKHLLEQERDSLIEQLRHASTTDYLTKLLNRRGFIERASALIENASREGKPVAILLFDIDHFKSVNDVYGHTAGDLVLSEVATIGHRALRPLDLFARYGGEEFIVLANDCTQSEAEHIASRLRHTVETHVFESTAARFGVTISLGVVSAAEVPFPSLEALIAQADKALYRAKAEGRNRAVQLAYSATGTAIQAAGSASVSS